MRVFIFLILLFSISVSFSQSLVKQKSAIDSLVAAIDADGTSSKFNFNIHAMKKVFYNINYEYLAKHNRISKIVRRFKLWNDSTVQTFYFKNAQLIYATEHITSYYVDKNQQDSILWGGTYYFYNGKLIDLVTLGHGKSETEEWNPQFEVLANCKSAKNDILRHNKNKNGR